MEEQEFGMTKDEMQKYLNQLAELGVSKEKAYEMFVELLGVKYPEKKED